MTLSDNITNIRFFKEGANTLSKEETTRLAAQGQLKFIQNLRAALVRIENKLMVLPWNWQIDSRWTSSVLYRTTTLEHRGYREKRNEFLIDNWIKIEKPVFWSIFNCQFFLNTNCKSKNMFFSQGCLAFWLFCGIDYRPGNQNLVKTKMYLQHENIYGTDWFYIYFTENNGGF